MSDAPPTLSLAEFDTQWRESTGAQALGGVDEAGRGALAGPVVAACVVLPEGVDIPVLNDSKQLTARQREGLVGPILETAMAWGVGWASAAEIDRINILQATLRACGRAIKMLTAEPDFLLTDYLRLPAAPCPFEPIVKGDAQSQAVAAASVLAKVARDRIMTCLETEYPQYGFASHKGYGSARLHQQALAEHGPCTLHRLSFQGVLREPTLFDPDPPRTVHRAASAPVPATLRPPGDVPDWFSVLTGPLEALHPAAFLPECEYE